MFQFRDKVLVSFDGQKIEGYIFAVPNPTEVYVILTGNNTKPVLVETKKVQHLEIAMKRKRGRPRKEKK